MCRCLNATINEKHKFLCQISLSFQLEHVGDVDLHHALGSQLLPHNALHYRQFGIGIDPDRMDIDLEAGREKDALVAGVLGIRIGALV